MTIIDRNKKGSDVDVCVDVAMMSDPTAIKNTRTKNGKVREKDVRRPDVCTSLFGSVQYRYFM
jgi:hypothetical protein